MPWSVLHMNIEKEIEGLASDFEACRRTLSAIGDETRQHIILEMMRMDRVDYSILLQEIEHH